MITKLINVLNNWIILESNKTFSKDEIENVQNYTVDGIIGDMSDNEFIDFEKFMKDTPTSTRFERFIDNIRLAIVGITNVRCIKLKISIYKIKIYMCAIKILKIFA